MDERTERSTGADRGERDVSPTPRRDEEHGRQADSGHKRLDESRSEDDRVDEASIESFPASDPPAQP